MELSRWPKELMPCVKTLDSWRLKRKTLTRKTAISVEKNWLSHLFISSVVIVLTNFVSMATRLSVATSMVKVSIWLLSQMIRIRRENKTQGTIQPTSSWSAQIQPGALEETLEIRHNRKLLWLRTIQWPRCTVREYWQVSYLVITMIKTEVILLSHSNY